MEKGSYGLKRLNQRGTLYEIPILILFFALLLAYLIPAIAKYGWAEGLFKTAIGVGIVASPFVALFLVFWVIGLIKDRFSPIKPKESDLPPTGEEKKP